MITSTAGGLRPPPEKQTMHRTETWLKAAASAKELAIAETALANMRKEGFLIEGQHWARGGIGPTDPIYYLPDLIRERLDRNAQKSPVELGAVAAKYRRHWLNTQARLARAQRQGSEKPPVIELQPKPPAVETAERLQGEMQQVAPALSKPVFARDLEVFLCGVICEAEKLRDKIVELEKAA